MSLPNVDLTSTWIPLAFLSVLLLYMVRLFLQERRESMALEAAEAAAHAPQLASPAETLSEPAPVEPAAAAEASPTAVAPVRTEPSRGRSGFVWRTAWIWLPFFAGVAGQAYLDVVKPLLEKAAS